MADNLLDKASILLTPTAYNDGSMLSVKPENGDGDFTFSRSSAATRVNAQGLVENVQIISSELVSNGNFSQIGTEEVSNGNFSQEGSELVTNGDFSNGLTNWYVDDGTSWTNVNNTAFCDGNNGLIAQNHTLTQNKVYKVTFDSVATNSSGKELGVRIANGTYSWNLYPTGTHTIYLTAGSSGTQGVLFYATNGWTGSIDNVSVKEVGQDWTLGTGWSIGEDKASRTAQSGSTSMYQSVSFTANKSYKITYDLDISAGSFLLRIGGGALIDTTPRTTSGTYTEYIVANSGNNVLNLRAVDGNFIGSITNISVKEVGQDWTFGTGWSMEDRAFYNDSATNQLSQSISLTSGVKYKLTFDIELDTVNQAYIWIGNSVGSVNYTGTNYVFYPTGSHTVYFTMPSSQTTLAFYGNQTGGAFYITNVSVKEITDDTDLPRINYEGFSYQDSLGSEEVVNGDFATDSNWTKGANWTISGGKAISNGTGLIYQTGVTYLDDKQYKVTFNADITSGNFTIRIGNTSSSVAVTQGLNTHYLSRIPSNTTGYLFFLGNGVGSIDNVSVKEVLGQEVVPDSGCGSWLLEGQSTNLIPHSEDFSQWVSIDGVVITDNFTTSPDGTQNASKLVFNGTANSRIELQVSSSGTNAQSVYLKTESGTQNVSIGSSSTNLTEFTITDQWVRYTHTGSGTYPRILCSDAATIYVWGCQYESGDTSTSYIPTNGATSTRLQDIANNSGNSTLINSTEGVLYADIAALANDLTNRAICITKDGTLDNIIVIQYNSVSQNIRFLYRQGAVSVADLSFAINDVTQFHKVAGYWKQNEFKLFIDGAKVGEQLSGNVSANDVFKTLNFNRPDGQNFYGKAKALAVYKEALTDANLRSLTYPNPVATTFDLDFDTIAEQFTFTRGSEATFVNAQGLIESTASNDAPRIDYSTGAKAFLLENQSTNLIPYSSDFSQWNKISGGTGTTPVVTTNNTISPDGTQNADKVVFDKGSGTSTSNLSILQANFTSQANTSSIYVKADTPQRIVVRNSNTFLGYDIGTEWTRIEKTDNGGSLQIGLRDGYGVTGVPNTATIYLWGAQVEAQSYATSYIPTSGASATRNQELCNNATPVINSEEGTLYAEISALANDGTIRYLSLSDGTSNNRVAILYYSSSNNIRMIVSSNGTNYADKNYGVSSVLDFHKIAIKYKENDFALWVDGIEAKTDNSGNAPIGLDNLSFSIGGGNPFFGNTKGLKYYPKALADVQLEDLTTI